MSLRALIQELQRRKVFQSVAAYLVAAWLVLQVIDVIGPALGINDRFMTVAVITLAIGLPLVALVSWFFELTAGGLRRETSTPTDASGDAVSASGSSATFTYVIIAMLIAALAVSLFSRSGGPGFIEEAEAATITLAVLPLQSLGASTDESGFVEGLHDDLLTMLSRISSLRVISRTSVLQFAGSTRSIPDIGAQLGAGTILEGSVQRSGDRVRVNVQLIDAASDEHLWAEIFERPFEARALFSIQREIAQAIARQLQIALTGEDEAAIQRQPTENSAAYQSYLLGRQRMAQRNSESLTEAEGFLRRAIGHDPDYADAWASLAEVFVLQHDYAGLDQDSMHASAMRAVQRALSLAPQLARAHGVLAELRRMNDDFQGAEASFARAMELNPNESLAAHWFGNMLYAQGRMPESIVWYQRALEIDPLSVTISNALAQAFLAAGQADQAKAQYARSTEIDPDFIATYAHLAQLERFVNGRPDIAVELLFKAYQRDPEHSEYPALMAEALLELDSPVAAARWSARAIENAPDHWWPSRVAILLALNQGDEAAVRQSLDSYGPNIGYGWLRLVAERNLLMDAGDIEGARQLFVEARPDLFSDPPKVDHSNFYIAPALAVVHLALGEEQRSRQLLEGVLQTLASLRADGFEDFDLSEVEAYALLGNSERALDILETQLENNWLNLWWFVFDSAQLRPLAEEPRFLAIRQAVEDQMRALRANLDDLYLTPPALEFDAESDVGADSATATSGADV